MILHCLSSTCNICLLSLVLGLMFFDVYVYCAYFVFNVFVSSMCVCVYVCVFSIYVYVYLCLFISLVVVSTIDVGSSWCLMCHMNVFFVLEVYCECFVFYGLCVLNAFSMIYTSYVLGLCLLWFVCLIYDVCPCLISPFAICWSLFGVSIEGWIEDGMMEELS